jgi:hypothetical protein
VASKEMARLATWLGDNIRIIRSKADYACLVRPRYQSFHGCSKPVNRPILLASPVIPLLGD